MSDKPKPYLEATYPELMQRLRELLPSTTLAQATNGQIPIGSTGADPVLATVTGTASQITVTDGAGSITLSLPDPLVITGLTTSGAMIGKITTVTDTYQILTTDQTVVCNKATGFTVTMPVAAVGQIFNVKNIGLGAVTLTAPGTDTFDEVDADLTITQYDSLTLQCRLANKWIII